MSDSKTGVKATHGFRTENTGPDDVKRAVDLYKYADGKIAVEIKTYWKGSAEPLVTRLHLTQNGFQLLHDAMMTAMHNIEDYCYDKSK